jgi:hypothetical protein
VRTCCLAVAMADRLSALLTKEVAWKARRAEGSPSTARLP